MTETLKYGKKNISFVIPEGSDLLEINEPDFDIKKSTFQEKLLSVLPGEKMRYDNVGIVVSDKTRLCGYPLYLPWLVDILLKLGANKENITFYIAYGTHAPQSEEESLNSYGELYREYNFVHHNCSDELAMTELGVTKRGTPCNIRSDVLKSSLLITFGSISHHYFAGFGGGRKLLFPGLAVKKSVYKNHGLFLDPDNGTLHTGCQPGKLHGNPIAEDLKEIDDMLPPKISIHGILNSNGKVCKLLPGKDYNDFIDACGEHDKYFKCGVDKQYDMVIASSGGYPKDINFIQAHKALHNAASFVEDGGKLILLAECADGIGSDTFMKYLEIGSFGKTFEILRENYQGNGGTALSLMTKTKRIEVFLYTSLNEEVCKLLQTKKIKDKDIKSLIESHSGSLAMIRNASLLIKSQ